MTNPDIYIPSDVQLGGQRTSSSQLKVLTTCWQEGWLAYMAPHPEVPNSSGLTSRKIEAPLGTGMAVHRGLHQYMLSGWRDGEDTGERDVMQAIKVGEEALAEREHDFATPEEYSKACTHTNRCLVKFDELSRGGSLSEIRVAADKHGEPILEKEFQIPLADGKFVYTDKIDGLFIDRDGYRRVGEYKTSTASFAEDAKLGLTLTGQNLVHMAVLTTVYPEERLDGILHFTLVKDRSERSAKQGKPWVYETQVTITPEGVEAYMRGVVDVLYELVDRSESWRELVSCGWEPYEAALNRFPQTGIMNGMCKRYRRLCQFAPYCEAIGVGSRMLLGFRPRIVDGKPYVEDPVNIEEEPFDV